MASQRTPALAVLPSVQQVLALEVAHELRKLLPAEAVRQLVRDNLRALRTSLAAQETKVTRLELLENLRVRLEHERLRLAHPKLRRVLNATGVVLHTNLGRAPLGAAVLRALEEGCVGYATLEYQLEEGRRGHRDRLVTELCTQLTGAEDALVVNNNAAAVLLVVTALAAGREVIVSRGELVEIGGGFRIPELMVSCGARLVEVGTTNRTRLEDYARALGPQTAALLKVHRSNFVQTGFVAEVELKALSRLARQHNVPLLDDLGSGLLLPSESLGLPSERSPQDSLAQGSDLVMFSGDKLFGGPQAGIILGKTALISALRKHPLARALRPGRLVFAALEATLKLYATGQARTELPVLAMLAQKPETVKARALRLQALVYTALGEPGALGRWDLRIVASEARVGGGSLPMARLSSWALAVGKGHPGQCVAWERGLRTELEVPIVGRLAHDELFLELHCLRDEDLEETARGLAQVLRRHQEMSTGSALTQPGSNGGATPPNSGHAANDEADEDLGDGP